MRRTLALLAVFLAGSAAARADVVELSGGTRLEGDVLEAGEHGVRILLPAGGEVSLARADVKSVTVDPDGPGGGRFTRYTAQGRAPGLQTGLVHYEKAGAPRIDLVGAVHVADAGYYAEVQSVLDREGVVLFEMVRNADEIGGKKPEHVADPAVKDLDALRKFQKTLGTLLDLSFQVDGIDYRRRRFVHADMTLDEFMAAGGDRFSKRIAEQMESVRPFLDMISKVFEPTQGASETSSRLARAVRGLVKPLLASMLGSKGDEAGLVLGGEDMSDLIVTKRNDVCMAMLDAVLRSRDPTSIAIFYGSAHMPDFEKRLLARGYVKAGGRWLTAWNTGAKPDTKSVGPVAVPPAASPAMN